MCTHTLSSKGRLLYKSVGFEFSLSSIYSNTFSILSDSAYHTVFISYNKNKNTNYGSNTEFSIETEHTGNNVKSEGYTVTSTGTSFELIESYNTTDTSLFFDTSLLDASMHLIALG